MGPGRRVPGQPEPGQEAACQGAVASGVAGRAHLAERSRPAERRGERWALLEAGGCGRFSAAEKLLPLADTFSVFSRVESLIMIDSSALLLGAVALLVGEVGLITVLPDDNTALVAVQAVTGVAAGAGALTLFAASALFG